MDEKTEKKNERNYSYDILRIMACLGIVCVHETYLPKPQILSDMFQMGAGGVQIFFVMSGWWAAVTFHKKNLSTTEYYKKRFLKILPAYYLAITFMMIFQIFAGSNPVDEWGLGYARYFFALNTIVPSNDYHFWNNLYGLWTMGDFIWFYILAPLLLRKCSFRKSCVLFLLSLIIKEGTSFIYIFLFGNIETIDSLDVLSGASFPGVLMHFIIGVMCYYSVKENKKWGMYIICSLVLMMAMFKYKPLLIWDVIAVLLLWASYYNGISLRIKNTMCINILSDQTYHIYLFHALGMEIAMMFMEKTAVSPGVVYYMLWLVMAIVMVGLFCFMATRFEQIIKSMIQVKKNGIHKEA